ncbi:MAG TPA: hypothetical protein VER04_06630 [Polyangiaceae bacterium]|nr:hypothetical protein [Polyangiaceae bacterium]
MSRDSGRFHPRCPRAQRISQITQPGPARGRTVATTRCDPLGKLSVQLGWVDIQRNALHSASGHGKMSCAATLAKAGPTVVRATLAFGVRPLTATINRADLVVKQ